MKDSLEEKHGFYARYAEQKRACSSYLKQS